MENLVELVWLEALVQLDDLDDQDQLGQSEGLARLTTLLDQLAPLAHLDRLVLQAKRVRQAPMPRTAMESPARKEMLERLVMTAIRVQLDQRAKKDQQALTAPATTVPSHAFLLATKRGQLTTTNQVVARAETVFVLALVLAWVFFFPCDGFVVFRALEYSAKIC